MRRWMSWLGYILFGIIMFVIFLYVNFPYQNVKTMLEASVRSYAPARLSIDRIKARPPLGVEGLKVAVTAALNGESVELLRADRVVVSLQPLSWIRGNAPLRVEADAYGGVLHTVMNVSNLLNPGTEPMDIVIQDVDLGRHAGLRTALAQEVAGILEGEISFHPGPGGLSEGKLNGHLTVKNAAVEGLRNVPVDLGRLTFASIDCILTLSDGMLRLAPLRARGMEADGTLEGILRPREQIGASTLTMRGRVLIKPVLAQRLGPLLSMVRPSGSAAGEVPFVLTGTVDRPHLRLTGARF